MLFPCSDGFYRPRGAGFGSTSQSNLSGNMFI